MIMGGVVPASGYCPVRILNSLQTTTTFRRKKKLLTSATKSVRARNTTSSMSKNANEEMERRSFKDYLQHSKHLLRSSDGGPPRWFSPLECSSALENSPLFLSLPGLDGIGLGLSMQYQRLGQIFNIWCLHIPIDDRTPFPELVNLVERTVRLENHRSPNRPIYLVGESFGGCLALAVAACNPDIDLVLILANPATSFRETQIQTLIPSLEVMPYLPDNLISGVPYLLSLMTDSPSKLVLATLEKGLPLQQTVGEISQGATALTSYLSVMSDVLSAKSLLWKLKLVSSACAFANSRLHAVKAQTLILSSGKDKLLPSREEAERLKKILPICDIRYFNDSGHALFLESSIDLVTIIMGSSFYRRHRNLDYGSDYLPPSPSEFKKLYESTSFIEKFTSPVMLSTLKNGKIVRGLEGIPTKGPVILIGYHMMVGLELSPLVSRFWIDRDIHLRAIAHPFMFKKLKEGNMLDLSAFDVVRIMGAVPVSPTNLYRLLSLNSHVLLYPGGIREAFHRKATFILDIEDMDGTSLSTSVDFAPEGNLCRHEDLDGYHNRLLATMS